GSRSGRQVRPDSGRQGPLPQNGCCLLQKSKRSCAVSPLDSIFPLHSAGTLSALSAAVQFYTLFSYYYSTFKIIKNKSLVNIFDVLLQVQKQDGRHFLKNVRLQTS